MQLLTLGIVIAILNIWLNNGQIIQKKYIKKKESFWYQYQNSSPIIETFSSATDKLTMNWQLKS